MVDDGSANGVTQHIQGSPESVQKPVHRQDQSDLLKL